VTPILTATVAELAPPVALITAEGELDADSQVELRGVAMTEVHRGRTRLVVDLTAVTFCDSAGLSLFVDLHRATRERGGWLRLAGANGVPLIVLRATNLDQVLSLHPTAEAALAADPS
jgi:anti-sigma B factor antagonist